MCGLTQKHLLKQKINKIKTSSKTHTKFVSNSESITSCMIEVSQKSLLYLQHFRNICTKNLTLELQCKEKQVDNKQTRKHIQTKKNSSHNLTNGDIISRRQCKALLCPMWWIHHCTGI